MLQTKAAVTSLGVLGPIVAILVIALGMFGVDIAEDVSGMPEKIAGTIDSVLAIVAIVVGIIGRVRAEAKITGVFKAK